MSVEWLWAVSVFATAMTFTPGPNNVMLTTSGANFGYRRSIPHMLGITIGFPTMIAAVGLGLAGVFQNFPWLHEVLKYAGAAYLLWLAWHIARSGRAENATGRARPLSFFEAAAFQWVNGKAWIAAIGALSAFTTVSGQILFQVMAIALVFGLVSYPSCSIWTAFGVAIGRLLSSDRALRTFNVSMAALLVLSIVPVFWA